MGNINYIRLHWQELIYFTLYNMNKASCLLFIQQYNINRKVQNLVECSVVIFTFFQWVLHTTSSCSHLVDKDLCSNCPLQLRDISFLQLAHLCFAFFIVQKQIDWVNHDLLQNSPKLSSDVMCHTMIATIYVDFPSHSVF